jgi:CRP-like cAMP-binding protein
MNLYTSKGSTENRLLAALPGPVLTELESQFAHVLLDEDTMVYDVGDEIEHIYFPISGIASLQTIMKHGRAVDTSIVGRDGALGLMTTSPHQSQVRCVVRSTLSAFKISAVKFRRAAVANGAIFGLALQFSERLLFQTQSSAARYAVLSIESRLATCLLEASDLLSSDKISLTQEVLGEMLAVRRTSISEIAAKFRDAGLISYSRGVVTILDRERLLKLSQAVFT